MAGSSLLIGYLYFIQGIVLSLPAVIPLTYKELPGYNVLSLFSAAWLPFSFKFVSAPFIETYASLNYGRRKTWVVIGSVVCALLLLALSYFTSEEYTYLMAASLFLAVFLMSLQDISTDALAVKELKDPERASFLQAALQQAGTIVGSLIFMKLISREFAEGLGLSEPIMSVAQYMRAAALVILLPTIYIHFTYREQLLEEEKHLHSQGLLEIFSHYRVFFNKKWRLCRQAVVFVLYLQGLSFFAAGYEVELMKGGFSKQTLTTIRNIVVVPVMFSTFLFSTKLKGIQNRSSINRTFMCLRIATQLFGYFFNPSHTLTVAAFLLLMDILMIGNYILDCNIINSFPASALSGMFITMLNSSRNFGTNHSIQLWLIGKIGFGSAAILGIAYSLVVATQWKRIFQWIEDGKIQQESQPLPADQNKVT